MIRTILTSAARSVLDVGVRPTTARLSLLLLIFAGCDRATPASESLGPRDLVPRLSSSAQWGPWSEPVNVTGVNSAFGESQPTLSPDELSLYFASGRPGGLGGNDIWVSRRSSTDSPWQEPINLGAPVNTSSSDKSPAFSIDGLLLFFHSDRPGGQGEVDIYVSSRTHKDDDFDWGPAIGLGTDVNTSGFDAGPMYLQQAEDGPTNLYFGRGPTSVAIDIYSAAITRDGQTLGPALPVPELNFAVAGITDAHPTISKDGNEVIYFSTRPDGFGLADLYVSTRQSVHSPWSTSLNLGSPLNTPFTDTEPSLSFDGGTLLFISNRPGGVGGNDVWMSTRAHNDK